MLDKVVSKTRPTYLPPKPRSEDKKHMQDWEKMMKHSRAAGEYAWDLRLAPSIIVDKLSLLGAPVFHLPCFPHLPSLLAALW